MESIQLAQMLADLSDLNAAQESQAAVALVNANKTLGSTGPTSDPSKHAEQFAGRPSQRHLQRVGSASSIISRTASPAKFDKFGRRILTPPLSRTNSAQGSVPGTPRREAEPEDDVDRANSLMALYDIRAKLKQQDNTSLMKLREKIEALKDRQHAEKKEVAGDSRQNRYVYPKPPS
ncbi:hypothetical protein B0T19DRAFT_72810 [Cercophora scortea]|uniref:Uncharacterized protein n=1 Tax=Cercophora scortea TaxID=314031 RepID=A0AAE0MLW7_9PEZI|nr:hypothetical protein B0T19DRAFT_72810 [Cercophora scortea]